MNRAAPLFLLGLTAALLVLPAKNADAFWWRKPMADFYVAPDGNDAWSGKLSEPTRDGKDGPFATVQRAQKAVRDLGPRQAPGPVKVLLRDGTYRITEPLVFTPQDAAVSTDGVTYSAYGDEKPVISGGQIIDGWSVGPDGIWSAPVPRRRDSPWVFSQLFINGQRRQRCRMPNDGYFRSAGPIEPLADRKKARSDVSTKKGFRYNEGDIEKWDDWQQMNVVLFHSWTASVHWLEELDPENRIVRFTAPSGWPVGYWEKDQRYYIENVRAALDRPGEWYLDTDAETVYYIPMPGERPEDAVAVAPVAKQLLRVEGDPEIGLFAENLTFEGISFQHAAWDLPRDKAHDGQAAVNLTGAIYVSGARNCVFRDIEVAHVGTYGMWFAAGSQNNLLQRSELHDLGAGGVKIGETRSETNEATACRENTVDNCFIHDGGHIARAGIGAWIGRSSYNTISHNEICDFDYSAVSVGWSWGYAASSANHNVVEYNHLHHIGNGVLSDMGGIYCLGISPGTILRGNIMHDVFSYSYGGWGLYTDEGSTHILMEKNVVYNTKSGGFHQHYGRENIVRNNIFAFSREGQIIRSREEEHSSFTIEKNIVIFDNGQPLGGNWANGNYTIDGNIYWDVTGQEFDFSGYTFDEWKEEGNDVHSIIADPKFRDAQDFDFRLKAASPADMMMIEPLQDFDNVGLYGPRQWTRKPKNVTHRTVDPNMKPPRSKPRISRMKAIKDDFEDTAAGEKPGNATVSGEDNGASIRVTDETAAQGKHALKFVDAPGLSHEWQPHMVYKLLWPKGIVHASFQAKLGEKAILWHEWRDSSSPYKVGPSIRFAAGTLKAAGKNLMAYPLDTWIKVEFTCPLGKAAKGTYDLTVSVAGQEPRTFPGLPFGNADWDRITWVGFVSEATEKTTFYIDDVQFTRDR